jgi:hypothetical protein
MGAAPGILKVIEDKNVIFITIVWLPFGVA